MTAQIPYTLGLDIGMASVGAAVLGPDRILGLHVRSFDKAELPKGESLNAARRIARSTRRRLRRRAFRLLRLRRLLKRHGLLKDQEPPISPITPWKLRADALNQCLSDVELASVIYHLIKHRGFQSNRKSEIASDAKIGEMVSGVKSNQALLAQSSYRTIGELAFHHEAFANAKRNKAGAYQRTFERGDLLAELKAIFNAQREFKQGRATLDLQVECEKLLMARKPTLSGKGLLDMVGYCVFEEKEHRAPKSGFRAEQFVWLTKLNNLRLTGLGDKRGLDERERAIALPLPFDLSKITYKQLRDKLGLDETVRFGGLSYRAEGKNPEESTLFEAKSFHAMRKIYEKAGEKSEWQKVRLDPDRLDLLAYALTCFKDDAESRVFLQTHGFSNNLIDAALFVSFSEFIRLSQKALIKILPFMIQGQRYDQAVQSAGYAHHSHLTASTPKHKMLPQISRADFPNPIVYRALNQARKLVNAIIREYGPPSAVHIELARDLARSFEERREIEKGQIEFQKEKKKAAELFRETFDREPNAKNQDLLKMRLYREQDGQCAYSQKPIDLNRLFESSYAEVDHALPYSRSLDDSQNNKVLVLIEENRNKGNRTPYEYLDGASESNRWQQFVAWVHANKKIRQAKRQRLLRVTFGAEEKSEFLIRNLNDTRYICRAFKTLLESHLQLASNTPDNVDSWRCLVLSGQLTAFLRARWGLLKVREDGDLHHAMDAAVIAACSYSMVKRLADYARAGELSNVRDGFVDPETGEVRRATRDKPEFPMPWPHFRKELLARLSDNPAQALESVPGYAVLPPIGPIRVSRAPLRRGSGEAHKGTIRSVKAAVGQSTAKTPLKKLKLKTLENIVGFNDPRNAELIAAIKARLIAHNDDGEKAFSQPLYKPSAPGKAAPLIRSVKVWDTQISGVLVRQGIADNDCMLRVDIFNKNGKYYAIPLYVADAVRPTLPLRAVVANKPETQWPELDESYQFCFSLHKNDWVCVRFKEGEPVKEGYFASLDRSNGGLSLWVHDRDRNIGRDGLLRSIGIKNVDAVEKYHVDVLGRLYRAKPETREPLHGTKKRGG